MSTIYKRCSTAPMSDLKKQELREKLIAIKKEYKLSNASLPILSIPVVYHVVYNNDSENIPLDRIKANHNQINLDFVALNSDMSKIPTTGIYSFGDSIKGTPNILFRPLDYNDLTENVDVKRYFSNNTTYSGINELISDFSPTNGYLNIYIADLQDNLLGQAIQNESGYAACAVSYFTVGSQTLLGIVEQYGLGRTLTHEIGHTLSLSHPWDVNCGTPIYDDVPVTKNPNRDGDIDLLKFCNKYNDLEGTNGTKYQSCTSNTTVPPGHYELFFQYMEYVSDDNMVMFSEDQSIAMYDWVNTTGRGFLDVNSESSIPITTSGTFEAIPDVEIVPNDEGSSSMIFIIVGIVVGVMIIIGIGVGVSKSKSAKLSTSYQSSQLSSNYNPYDIE